MNSLASNPWSEYPCFDGGDTGCGELLLDLLLFCRRHPGGRRITVRALDAGAPQEIPAWCRMTGNHLVEARSPFYLIEIK